MPSNTDTFTHKIQLVDGDDLPNRDGTKSSQRDHYLAPNLKVIYDFGFVAEGEEAVILL